MLIEYSRTNIRKFSLASALQSHWNTLPGNVRHSTEHEFFKNILDKENMTELVYDFDE